jgi:hypothetical protein
LQSNFLKAFASSTTKQGKGFKTITAGNAQIGNRHVLRYTTHQQLIDVSISYINIINVFGTYYYH